MSQQNPTVVAVHLDDEALRNSINKLVEHIDTKLSQAAQTFDDKIAHKMQPTLETFASSAKTAAQDIKNAFSAMGLTFDQFAKAMEKAAKAASSMGGSGNGSGNSGASANNPSTNTIAELKQQIVAQQKVIDQQEKYTAELQRGVNELAKMKRELKNLTTDSGTQTKGRIKDEFAWVRNLSEHDIPQVMRKLSELETVRQHMRNAPAGIFKSSEIQAVTKQIDRLQVKLNKLRLDLHRNRPLTISETLGMRENDLESISKKMQAISRLRSTMDIQTQRNEISRLNNEFNRLSRTQNEILGRNAFFVQSNNALARSFNYIRNRLIYTLSVGALTSFVKQIYEIRGQYELLERSIGVLFDSFQTGTRIFNELNQMALKSPFTLIDLGTAAKQLAAYNFKATEVVNVTRRLADISAALGVPMERLVYNLGQIRAQTVLTARDARDFANAGLAIVPALADMYSRLEGRVVSTADVFDRMKKKAVSYNDVMSVLNELTDEGGKFFDFQAKQADTLKVQLANLSLAWNNMLNEMGKSHQGLLSLPVQGLKQIFLNWKDISHWITMAALGVGAYKAAQLAMNFVFGETKRSLDGIIRSEARANVTRLQRIQITRSLTAQEQKELTQSKAIIKNKKNITRQEYASILSTKELTKAQSMQLAARNKNNKELLNALLTTGKLTKEEMRNALATSQWKIIWDRFTVSLRSFGRALKAIAMNPMTWIFALVTAAYEIYDTFSSASEATKEFNKAVSDGAKENLDSLKSFTKDYRETYQSLYEWIKDEETGGYRRGKAKNIPEEEALKAWEAIREEIIQSSSAGQGFVSTLEKTADVNDKVRKGFKYIEDIKSVNAALKEMDETTIKIQQDYSKLWNLWLGSDSLKENIQQFVKSLRRATEKSIDIGQVSKEPLFKLPDSGEYKSFFNDLQVLRDNLKETADSMVDFFTMKGLNPNQEREAFSQIASNITESMQLGAEESFRLRLYLEEQYVKAREEYFKKSLGDQYKEEFNTWSNLFNTRQELENKFLNWLMSTRYSATQEMFQNMSEEEIGHIDWSQPKWKKWAEDNATDFANEYHLSFNQLRDLVNRASQYVIRIPVLFDFTKINKPILQELEDADAKAKKAKEEIDRLRKAQKNTNLDKQQQEKVTNALTKAEKDLNDALKEGAELQESGSGKKKKKSSSGSGGGRKSTPEDQVAKALKDELSIIKEMQSNYEKLRKVGFNATTALNIASSGYEGTLSRINAILTKFGVKQFKASDFVSNDSADPNKLLKALEKQRTSLIKSGKVKTASLKDLDVEIQKLTVDAKAYNMQKITDGLNREFEKLHNDYELSVELDANPELGDMFADMFNIDSSKLPHNMADLIRKAQKFADDAISEYNKLDKSDETPLAPTLDIMRGDIQKWAEMASIDVKSELFEKLKGEQDKLREQFKKYMLETEKDLDDYVKKYGITADRIAEIEAEKQRKLNNLNNAYTSEQQRKLPEYLTKLDAINRGAAKEKDKVWFDDFKSSELYSQMFDRIEDVSSATLELLREKVKQVKKSLDELDPSQVKELTQQFEKIDEELIRRNPFNNLVKNFKNYISALKNQKQVEQDYLDAQKNYDAQMQVVAALEEQLKQKEHQTPLDKEGINSLKQEVIAARDLLKILKQILGIKEEDNNENKEAVSKFKKQATEIANSLQEISKIVGTIGSITEALGLDEGVNEIVNDIAQSIDGVAEMAQGMAQMSTNPIAGVGSVIGGFWKTISGWFDNSNKRIDRKVKESERYVKNLEYAYIELERAVEKSLGNAETRARKLAIENKRLQLSQLQRQLQLEQSRKKKNRDDDKIIDLQKQIRELNYEILDMTDDIVNNLLGSDIKSAAEDFVNTWVDAWRQGEETMDGIKSKFDDMIDQMIMKSLASKLVATRLQPIWDMVENITSETSESGSDITLDELKRIKELVGERSIAEAINQDLKNLYGALGIAYGSGKGTGKTLSNLQQGIQSITEDTAGALEAYMNSVNQQVYLHSELLTQIRDAVVTLDLDVQTATIGQILLQLQQSHQVQMAIQSILLGWSNASGLAMRVEMI